MFHTFQRFSLEKQLFASFVGFAAVLLLLTMGVSLILDINRQMQSTDSLIRSSASYIASLDSVKNMLKQGYPDPEVTKELDSFNESLEDLHVIVICDANSLRFYHTNRQDVGDSFVNGDQEAILQGSEPYITTGYGTYGTQRRAFHAVEDADGTILGFVMTSTFTAEISAHIHRLVLYCLVLFGAALAVALGLSRGLVALLRRSLLGYHPTELLELYLQQGEVLNAVEDGLVATDPKGKVVFANQTACRLLRPGGPHRGGGPQPLLRHQRPPGALQRNSHPRKVRLQRGAERLSRQDRAAEAVRRALRRPLHAGHPAFLQP